MGKVMQGLPSQEYYCKKASIAQRCVHFLPHLEHYVEPLQLQQALLGLLLPVNQLLHSLCKSSVTQTQCHLCNIALVKAS